jgi:hypothetical protein
MLSLGPPLQAGTRSFIGDIDFSHHVSITNHHRGPWIELNRDPARGPKMDIHHNNTRHQSQRKHTGMKSDSAGILHDSGKSTQPNCCVPFLQAASSRSLLLSYIISMMILITTRERGIWILQIRNSKPHNGRSIHDTDSFAIPKYATHTKAQHRPISRALTCCSALRPCLFLLSVNHSDFTLRVPHPQPLVER